MNKFKVFLTTIAFVWLWSCGFWAIFQTVRSGDIAWVGLWINAWSLPIWMLLRFLWPGKFRGEQREPAAFAAVLTGVAVALLSDSEKGQPVYLAIYNLFVVLVYLFHLSALRHPTMPALDASFPCLVTADGKNWSAAEHAQRGSFDGLLLVFLRSSYCADSRGLLMQMSELLPELKRRGVGLVICSAEPPSQWSRWIAAAPSLQLLQLAPGEPTNDPFLAPGGAPLVPSAISSAAARPSQWLLDSEGFVVWRHLPGNYRTPGSAELLRGQLFRLQD